MPHTILAVPLPVELYRLIISSIDKKKDLCTLCLSSRTWYREAAPFLYRDTFLSNTRGLLLWCKAVVERPFLGKLVQEFSILFRQCWEGDCEIYARISQMLRHLPNLQRLILDVDDEFRIDLFEVFSIFEACPLQLARFDSRMVFSSRATVDFLIAFVKSRPNITSLSCRVQNGVPLRAFADAEAILPNLSRLVASSNVFIALRTNRPIQCLKIHLEEELDRVLIGLRSINETLTTLCVHRENRQGPPLHGCIRRLVESVPNLRTLCIHDDSLKEPPHLEDIRSSLAHSTCLENLAFNPYSPPSTHHQIPGGVSPVQFATQVMGTCPSLCTVTLPFWDTERLIYVKTPLGDVIGRPLPKPINRQCQSHCLDKG
ncbi:hypothetical protein JAAARDRAFT_198398 [Jaapia argillacea MUCL 33604]|uniref:F-box domain-containing protein n=1 Tax=Jaapia argillacea MUCL 33604 TaxID=933084 RepID=A0A067PPH1_9AGAM|nr:hypothetical protein JAAARDRAFT_198398 [Jaapia argillacea MUCL 33604]